MSHKKTAVSLEDLLKVKRAERPPAEFWAEFEREMRVKQLAAIVEPRPWWAPFIKLGARLSHYQLPVGAAAILALSFVAVREYREPERNVRPTVAVDVPALTAQVPVSAEDSALAHRELTNVEAASLRNEASQAVEVASIQEQSASAVPSLDAEPVQHEPTPSARYIAANLAAAQEDHPGLIEEVFGASARRVAVRESARDPLAQIAVPAESRRSRLLATAWPAVANASEVSARSSDRVTRRLTEERLYDSISRFGVSGDRVAIRF